MIGPGSARKTTWKVWRWRNLHRVLLRRSWRFILATSARNPQVNAFVRGVTAGATGAIAGAVVVLARRSVYDLPTILICLLSLGILFRWKIPEPVLIAGAAVAGLLLHYA